jgi:FkbM family methyltransferase
VVISYAQNAEDIRLWRIFSENEAGFYVDVGAGNPVTNSVTKLFYDAGWSGLNVEPGPDFALLAEARPRDTTLPVAVSSRATDAEMWLVPEYPELSSLVQPAVELLPDPVSVTRVQVRTARLDELVAAHAPDRRIDFLKIDVEGAEGAVLRSFDPRLVRPTVVVVEAIAPLDNRPTHEEWEPVLLESGYALAAFDGINRFYVPEESRELIPVLAYPISPLDRYVRHDAVAVTAPRDDELLPSGSWIEQREAEELRAAAREATELLSEVQQTVSWRVTRPLRAVRRSMRRLRRERRAEPRAHDGALVSRLDAAVRVLSSEAATAEEAGDERSLTEVLEALRGALTSLASDAGAAAWLLLLAADGSYPGQRDVEHATQALRTSGPDAFVAGLERRISSSDAAKSSRASLELLEDAVVVDVSQIASSDLHTGIQRVARECVSHWLRAGLPIRLSWFDRDAGVPRLLADEEAVRLRRWQQHLGVEERVGTRVPRASDKILVPWSCDLVLAELPTPEHSAAMRGLVQARAHRSLCIVCYDLIPFVAPESVDPRIVATFAEYLALLKHADRVSAISEQTAHDLRAFGSMLSGQGLHGPRIEAHPLPTEVPPRDGTPVEPSPCAHSAPLVLVVGVHAPRKNHVAVLEAAERLWRRGKRFELVFMGGSAWRAEGYFDAYVERLRREGRPLGIERRVSEEALWDAYRRARFTVFPSLVEGFGLPVAESLAAGTPAITSDHGSMAEIAAGGGALTVDPRNVDELEREMGRLLDDDELLERLRSAARGRDMGTWSGYADSVWRYFFPAGA